MGLGDLGLYDRGNGILLLVRVERFVMADRLDRAICRAQAFRAMLILARETYASRPPIERNKRVLVYLDEALRSLDEEIAAMEEKNVPPPRL